ncbi:plasmid pRiA4b ORF-3 family protein [Bacteroides caecimuris]|uniref:plasmid pRiA4b ORF-3 family protein n=1 Tax=Bacteroides caecimuris TaxID=1796613 RepID=UPI00243183BA|nr:plasmid pRiA4b ORF-3 family protein [Bacteroides caecimuris]
MNKKKNQTSIGLDALITEVFNMFTLEEQQELINILNHNGLEKLYQQMEEVFYDYQQPDYNSEATPIAAYLQKLWDMQTYEDYPFDEFKKDCTTVPAAELEKDLRNFILQLFIHYQGPLENTKEENRPFKLWYIYWAMEHYRMESSLNIILEIMRQSPTFLSSYCHLIQDEATIAIIYQLGQNQLPLLLSFMNENGIAPFGKEDICSAVAQIAINNPERRLEIINWFCQLLNSYYDRFERGEDNNLSIIDYITDVLMNIRAIETLPILEKIYKRFKIPNTLTRKGFKEIKKEMPRAKLKGLDVDSMEELMNLLNEFITFNENHKFDDNEFDEEYDDEFDDDEFDDDEFDDDEYNESFYIEEQTSKKLNIKISLINSDPEIYRIVEVPSNIRLESFADVINTAMGWEGYHMHLFQKGKTIYTTEESDDDFWFDPVKTVNSYSLSLGEILTRKGSHIKYEYDFGDSWMHRITLESQQAYKKDETQGIFLIDGANACPPEDCGGIYSYQEILEALKHPHSKAAKEYREWLGKNFNAHKFNAKKVERELRDFPIRIF